MTDLTLVVSNVYARNRSLRAYKRSIKRGRPDVIACQEAQWLGGMRGYVRHSGNGKRGGGVAVYTKTSRYRFEGSLLGGFSRRATDDGPGYVHPRFVTVVRFRHDGRKWAVVDTHANPGHRGEAREENVKLIARVTRICQRLERAGYLVILAADFNRTDRDQGPDTPRHLAKVAGMDLRLHGIDGIAHSRRLRVRDWSTWRPPGADHDAIRCTLTA